MNRPVNPRSRKPDTRLFSLHDRVPCADGRIVYRRLSPLAFTHKQAIIKWEKDLVAFGFGLAPSQRYLRVVEK